jgi:aldehyde:ferredoxin oxidoreductase
MKGGYIGKILFADLTKGSLEEKVLSDELARHFIGGYGIGARVLYDMIKPGVDPLGPENVLGFVSGPLTGAGALFGARYTVVCKSPVTWGWNDANSGGFFGPELKKAGFDAVFIRGASSKPVYLFIKDGKAEIRDASGLWGKDSVKTLEGLMEETGENKLRAALIGPAGEKQSLMSCVINDKHRAAARGGPGAVMGSKNLKAFAVRGTGKISVADPETIRKINAEIVHAMKNGPGAKMMDGMGTFGTGMGTDMLALIGDAPTKNWGGICGIDMGKASVEKLSTVSFDGKYKKKKYACANCPLGCGAHYHVDGGKWPVGETDRPEY